MKTNHADLIWLGLICMSLVFLQCETQDGSKQHQATLNTTSNEDRLICHEDFMSVYISKEQFPHLPYTIYVQDEHVGYHQAIAIAKLCSYFFGETQSFVILTVASHGCFVKREKRMTSFTAVLVTREEGGLPEIIHSIHLKCKRKMEELRTDDPLEKPRRFFCSKNGFHITIPRNITVPPLNLNAVRIPFNQNPNCRPKKRSTEAVTFIFPFTECGTRTMISDGNITHWINIEVTHNHQKGVVFRDTPFQMTVQCSFALTQMTQVDIKVQQSKSEFLSTLMNKGRLRTEMRFAKDSSYRAFHSSSDPPTVTELGQPVYVEVFVKHEDNSLVLLLEDCWATPTKDPHHPQRWNILIKGCPFTGDSHTTVVLPVSNRMPYHSLRKWFVVKLFSFVKPSTLENLVYFHCNTEICKGQSCMQPCINRKRQPRRIQSWAGQRMFPRVVSGGPILYFL